MPSEYLRKLRENDELRSSLAEFCDFDVEAPYSPMDIWFRLASGRAFVPIAQTASCGVYAALTEPRCGEHAVFFVSSEAQGGFIALDVRAALELIVALPYWFDCLKFSGGGSLHEMERASAFLERDLQDEFEDVEGRRDRLRHELGIGIPRNPLHALNEAVTSGAVERIQSISEGWDLASLFNSFTFDD